jgi:hypothetical protein
VGFKHVAEVMKGEGLPLATRKGRRYKEGERLSGAIVSRQRIASVWSGEWMSRDVGSCHKRDGKGG